MEKKCTHCGSKNLEKQSYKFSDSMDMPYPIDIYVCKDCGHIELFENKDKGPYKKSK